jgi:hypothetical protein
MRGIAPGSVAGITGALTAKDSQTLDVLMPTIM